eukprot:3661473-Amphidinium_carterae.2
MLSHATYTASTKDHMIMEAWLFSTGVNHAGSVHIQDLQVHAEFCQVGSLPEWLQVAQQPIQHRMNRSLVAIHDT